MPEFLGSEADSKKRAQHQPCQKQKRNVFNGLYLVIIAVVRNTGMKIRKAGLA
jgi:hypothetical protein